MEAVFVGPYFGWVSLGTGYTCYTGWLGFLRPREQSLGSCNRGVLRLYSVFLGVLEKEPHTQI